MGQTLAVLLCLLIAVLYFMMNSGIKMKAE